MAVKGNLVTIIIIGLRLVKIEILKEFSGALQFRGRLDFKESDKTREVPELENHRSSPFFRGRIGRHEILDVWAPEKWNYEDQF